MIKTQTKSHIWIIWIITFLNGLIFYIPIFALYLQQQLLDFAQVTLIMAFQSIFIIIFEIPSGAFADLFGRKKSLIIGAFLNLLSLFFLYIGSNFFILTLFAISSALFQSLYSGTIEAIIYDNLKENDFNDRKNDYPLKKITFKQFIAINGAIWPISASIASLLGSLLSVNGFKIAILATFVPAAVMLIIILNIKDPSHIKPDRKNILAQIKVSMKYIHMDNQIKLLLLSGFLVYSFAEVAFQMKPIYFSAIHLSIEYFGIIYTLSFAFSFLGSILSERISRYFSYKAILISAQILIGFLFFAPSFIPIPFINATFMSIESFFWGLRWPIQIDWINSRINSRERATINSTTNLMNNLGFTIFVILSGISLEIINPIWLIRFIGISQILTIFLLFGLKKQTN